MTVRIESGSTPVRLGTERRSEHPSPTRRADAARPLAHAASAAFAALLIIGCKGEQVPPQMPESGAKAAMASEAPPATSKADGEWTLPGRDPQGTRYSPLTQINAQNVKDLKVAWTFSTGTARGFEGQPLVVNNTMYVVTPWPNLVFAIDLTNPHGPLKWHYHPPTAPPSQGVACCDVVNRGASYADGEIILNRLDNHTVALDANNGHVLWDVQLDSIEHGSTMTMAAFAIDGKVYVGNSGAELGVRGWLAALDVKTGKVLWKAYSTGPDKDVLIGPDFKAQYPQYQGKDLGVSSWPTDQWKLGGGTAWGWVTYDPELRTIYYGTANPGVWNPDMRPGDNLWAATTFARDPNTGEARWAYQHTPHDSWDYDAVNESIPVDLPIGGQPRKLLVHFDRNGFAYTLDRETGKVLVARPFQPLNWATEVNLQNGVPARVASKETHQGVNTTDICPSSTGARDQQPAAFSPRTKLFYTPSTNLCMDYKGLEASYIAGTPYLGADVRFYAGTNGKEHRGDLIAWDPVTGKRAWAVAERFPVWSGPVVTASDILFYGNMEGWFKAVDARTGEVLWQFKCGSGIVGNPMTYMGPDGKQYVAVYSGIGGWLGATALGLSTTDPTAALGAVGGVPDLPDFTAPGGMVYVFALP